MARDGRDATRHDADAVSPAGREPVSCELRRWHVLFRPSWKMRRPRTDGRTERPTKRPINKLLGRSATCFLPPLPKAVAVVKTFCLPRPSCLSVCLSVWLSVCLSGWLAGCLSVRLSVWHLLLSVTGHGHIQRRVDNDSWHTVECRSVRNGRC